MKNVKNQLNTMGLEIFKQLYECLLLTTLQESLAEPEEEEDCDEVEYGMTASVNGTWFVK